MNADIPYLHCWVRRSFVKAGGFGLEEAYAFAIQSHPGRALAFHVMLKSGAHYRGVPIHALSTTPESTATSLGDCQLWDCFTFSPTVHVYNYLRDHDAECLLRSGRKSGRYLFTVDWLPDFRGPGFTHLPDQNKCGHVMAMDDGSLACLPTNRIAWRDNYFIGQQPHPEAQKYTVQTDVYQCESSAWDVSQEDSYFYGPKDGPISPETAQHHPV